MNELKDIIAEYKRLSSKIDENELIIKKQKLRKNEYEEKIIQRMKRYNIQDKPIELTNTKLIFKMEEKPQAISQKYLEENINMYFNKRLQPLLGSRSNDISNELYTFLINNRPKKKYEKLHEKKLHEKKSKTKL
tara:strand:- start:3709 stop:4110 length:402 start_codon:yes stop_codon:yes gene_type:complete